MNYDFKQTLLSRCMLSGLLAGLAAVITNFIFNYIFRVATGYDLSEVINVVSIIFSSIIVTLVAGVLYFLFTKMKNGAIIFTVLLLLLTALGIYAAFQTQRSNIATDQHDFKLLFAGMILIDGLYATFIVPYFISHQKIYS